ncbi:MAG TPA: hypothetical protein PK536_05645 [Ignavibacteria bacterium]|nr:hypothetical protein [Ignavibacteria bacterium]
MKKLLFAILILFLTSAYSVSQPVYIENFNYSVRDTIEGNAGWTRSSTSNNKAKIISPGLNYVGYTGSGIGNCAFIPNESSGEAYTCQFLNNTPLDQGTVYLSFLVRVDSMSLNATQGFVINLDEWGGSTNFNTITYFKKVSGNTFNIGIRKYTGSPVFSGNVYNTNTTYLIVASYTFKPGSSTNDVCKLYAFISGVPVNEPASPLALDSAGNDILNIGDVKMANSFNQPSGLRNSSMKIDGIRIGTSWNSTLFQNYVASLSMTALIQGFYNNVTNKMVKDTVTVSLRYNRSPYQIAETKKAVLDSNGSGIFNYNTIGNYSNYYIAVTHRNMVESWSRLTHEFLSNALSYNFSQGFGNTFGFNVIQKGSRYCFYNGEINHDGIIDVTDYQFVDNNSFAFASGYKTTDLNGDQLTDISDLVIVEENVFNFVQRILP